MNFQLAPGSRAPSLPPCSARPCTSLPDLPSARARTSRGPGPRATQMSEADRAQMRERMHARMSQRLDRLATRLDIKASQQDAWGAYRKTVESTFGIAHSVRHAMPMPRR